MLRWMKMVGGHVVALPLLWGGGTAAVFAVTIARDLLFVFSTVPLNVVFTGTAALVGSAVGFGLTGRLLYHLWGTVWTADRHTLFGSENLAFDPSLDQLRPGYVLDYNVRTWEVTGHTRYPYEGWPDDTWTLQDGEDTRLLEYEQEAGGTFRLSRRIRPTDVMAERSLGSEREAFPYAVREEEPPDTVYYQDTEYTMAERDARAQDETRVRPDDRDRVDILARSRTSNVIMGACGGVAEYVGVHPWLVRVAYVVGVLAGWITAGTLAGFAPGCYTLLSLVAAYFLLGVWMPKPPPERLDHYWRYESGDGDFVAFERPEGGWWGDSRWTARAGRTVEPYEFDNILPPSDA
jgi:phage shock protein PspC (stress-responsive transcriptional regulator)